MKTFYCEGCGEQALHVHREDEGAFCCQCRACASSCADISEDAAELEVADLMLAATQERLSEVSVRLMRAEARIVELEAQR